MTDTRPRALVVADSDSYLKWAVARALDLQDEWEVELVVVRNAVTPSATQTSAAVDGRLSPPASLSFEVLVSRLRDDPPDLLLLACRGPLIELLLLGELKGQRAARVVATGIPGIWFPPTDLGLRLRAACDLVIVHSVREREEVESRLPQGRLSRTGLASLVAAEEVGRAPRPRIVFAPQALVPARVDDRRRLLDALVATAERHPELDVVIKVRGTAGEAQTHAEIASFESLAIGRTLPPNLVFAGGPLREYLGDCVGFVTVSSTAVLEAVAAGVPSLVLDEFGVGADVINLVFEGSGLLGGLDDLEELRFRGADPAWRERNYFHADGDWVDVARALLLAPPADTTPMRDPLAGLGATPRRWRRRSVALGETDRTLGGWVMRLARPLLRWRARAAGLRRTTPKENR